jgi:peptidyl-prolyl cis-trans isomerase SurA
LKIGFLCALATLAVLAGWQRPARAEVADGIKAIVHDSIVTFQDVQEYTAPVADELRREYRRQPELFQKKLDEALDENLEVLLQRQLILHEFETGGYNPLPQSIIDEYVQQRIRERYGDRATLTKTLQAQGLTYEKFRQQIRDQFVVEQMRYANIARDIVISPHKIETYYLEHTNSFSVADQVKLRMIVLNKPVGDTNQTRQRAEEILTKLNEGAAFPELASIYSQGSQRSQGGDWGWVEKSVLRKELADAAFALKPGERSGVIDTAEACYLMLVEDRRPEHIKPLSDVRDEIEKALSSRQRDQLQKRWIERLKKKTFVRYF